MRRLLALILVLMMVLLICAGCIQKEETQTPDALTEVNRLVDLFVGAVPDAPGFQGSVLHELQLMLQMLDEQGRSGRLLLVGERNFVKAQSIVVEMDNGDILVCLTEPMKQDEHFDEGFSEPIEEEAVERALKTVYIVDDWTDKVHYVILAQKPSVYAERLYYMVNSASDRPPLEESQIPNFD